MRGVLIVTAIRLRVVIRATMTAVACLSIDVFAAMAVRLLRLLVVPVARRGRAVALILLAAVIRVGRRALTAMAVLTVSS